MHLQTSKESTSGREGLRPEDLSVTTLPRWVTREEIVEQFPISASTLARIPRVLLDFGYVGKNAVYDVLDVISLFKRLKGTSLKALIESVAEPTDPERSEETQFSTSAKTPGRPRKLLAESQRRRGRPRKAKVVQL